MKRIIIATALLATPAYATQSSILCKTDSQEYIDIVAKGDRTNDVLVQINGGKFLDGHSLLLNDTLIVTVELDSGGIMLNTSLSGDGKMMIAINKEVQNHTIKCKARQ